MVEDRCPASSVTERGPWHPEAHLHITNVGWNKEPNPWPSVRPEVSYFHSECYLLKSETKRGNPDVSDERHSMAIKYYCIYYSWKWSVAKTDS